MNELKELIKEVGDLDELYRNIDLIHQRLLKMALVEKNIKFFSKEFDNIDHHLTKTLNNLEIVCVNKRKVLKEYRTWKFTK